MNGYPVPWGKMAANFSGITKVKVALLLPPQAVDILKRVREDTVKPELSVLV